MGINPSFSLIYNIAHNGLMHPHMLKGTYVSFNVINRINDTSTSSESAAVDEFACLMVFNYLLTYNVSLIFVLRALLNGAACLISDLLKNVLTAPFFVFFSH